MMNELVRIGTRGSALALAQSGQVGEILKSAGVYREFELVVIRTSGDRIQDRSLAEIGGKGLFIKEIEEALLDGRVDLAVHSMKDLPGQLAPGLVLEGTLPRETPRDVLISNHAVASLADLPEGAVLGTSSLRRQAQTLAARPDLKVVPLRGNVDTRLAKLADPAYGLDATLLAGAGLNRLGKVIPGAVELTEDEMLPAIAQGTLGLEVREGDTGLREALSRVRHEATYAATRAERSLLLSLSGSCRIPLGGYAEILADGQLRLRGLLAHPSGSPVLMEERVGTVEEAEDLGIEVGRRLLERGGREILESLGILEVIGG